MINFTTLPAPGALAMPRPPGSPLATTSDFALALATISGPAGVGVATPAPPDTAGVAVINIGDVRQAIAGGGTILPDAPVPIDSQIPIDAVVLAVITRAPAETSGTPATDIVLPVETAAPIAAPVSIIEPERGAEMPSAVVSIIAPTTVALPSETSPVDAPKPRKRARPVDVASPNIVAVDVTSIIIPVTVSPPLVAGERANSLTQPDRAELTAPMPAATGPAIPAPVIGPTGDAPAPAKPQTAPAAVPTLIDTPSTAVPIMAAAPLATAPPSVAPELPRAGKGPARIGGEPVAMPASPVASAPVAKRAAPESISEPVPAASVAPLGVTPAPLPAAEPARVGRAIGAEPVTSSDPLAAAPMVTPIGETGRVRRMSDDRSRISAGATLPAVAEPTAAPATRPVAAAMPAPKALVPTIVKNVPAARTAEATAVQVEAPPVPTPRKGSTPTARPAPPAIAHATPVAVLSPAIQAAASTPFVPVAVTLDADATIGRPSPAPTQIAPTTSPSPTPSVQPVALAPTPREVAPPVLQPPTISVQPVAATPIVASFETALPATSLPSMPTPVAAAAIAVALAPTVVPPSVAKSVLAAIPGKRADTPVVVTVAPAPRTAPPAPAQQPAAQAFAAAMFAADCSPVVVDRDDPAADLAAGFPLSGLAPATTPIAVPAAAAAQQPALDLTRDDWMGSMIDRIETIRDEAGVRETRIRLTPDALGSVGVSIAQDDAGVLQVRFDADTPQTRAILAEAAPRLAEMAEARGLKLGGSSVDAGADQRRHNAQQPSAPVPVRPASAANDDTDSNTDSRIA